MGENVLLHRLHCPSVIIPDMMLYYSFVITTLWALMVCDITLIIQWCVGPLSILLSRSNDLIVKTHKKSK